ncbi:hypothetical protein D3C77_718920 [compost metagenome]
MLVQRHGCAEADAVIGQGIDETALVDDQPRAVLDLAHFLQGYPRADERQAPSTQADHAAAGHQQLGHEQPQ